MSAPRRASLWESLTPPSSWGDPSLLAVSADGVRLRFADGSRRLCATSGLWNVPLGYGNAEIADAVGAALRAASYLTLFRSAHSYAHEAAERLLALRGPSAFVRVLFSTSGSAANDLMMKLVRQRAVLTGAPQRTLVVGLHGSYHGLTYGAMSLSGEALGQASYGVDKRSVRHVTPHDGGRQLRQLFAREGERIAALVLEPVLGSGAYPLDAEFLETVADIRANVEVMLVADEVATGYGRTGVMSASSRWPVAPDILLLSKALTNGAASAAAVLLTDELCGPFDRADAIFVHGETQAGTPASCAAMLATASEFERLDGVRRAQGVSRGLDAMLTRVSAHPAVSETRGLGCFRAIGLIREHAPLRAEEVSAVVTAIRRAGAIVQPGPGCIQLIPAFVYDRDDLHELETAVLHGLDESGVLA